MLKNRLLPNDTIVDFGYYVEIKLYVCCCCRIYHLSKKFLIVTEKSSQKTKCIGCVFVESTVPLLLEKAIAVAYGRYNSLQYHGLTDSLFILIGYPAYYVNLNDVVKKDSNV